MVDVEGEEVGTARFYGGRLMDGLIVTTCEDILLFILDPEWVGRS